ncbi:hypothetical protein [Polaromonas sp.]|uniref:hypothetical protein n=1 Tax=Polaromonas sp. TaxID=1869339 RepID=UPI003753937D
MELNEKLVEKLAATKAKYEKVTAFAALLPLFKDRIISDELTGESYAKLSDYVGQMYCAWGVSWYTNTPTNYPEEKHSQVGFVNVYINSISLFGDKLYDFARQKLDEVLPSIDVHFYDAMNSNFYFLPHEAEAGLKKLEAWYLDTKAQCDAQLKKLRVAELQRELEGLS